MPLLALCAWPFVTAIIFSQCRLPVAVVASLVAGYLLLPSGYGFDFPLLPAFQKDSVAALSAILCGAVVYAQSSTRYANRSGTGREDLAQVQPGWLPRGALLRILLVVLLLSTFLTVLTNRDGYFTGATRLAGMSLYDAFSLVLGIVMMLLPLALARKFLASPETHRTLLLLLVVAGLCYSLLALYEVRMSPQLSRMVYGYFPHSWLQHIRGDGYRPIVFLSHGLLVGIFFAMTLIGAAALIKIEGRERRSLGIAATAWLAMTLVLVKSLGALIISILLVPIVLLCGRRIQMLVAASVAAIVLLYPMLRGADLVPTDRILAFAESIDSNRASSLNFRFESEDLLLEKASEKPLFGWGGYGRNRAYDEAGQDMSVTDGYWIIIVGIGGWIRYLTVFGLLTLPILLLTFRNRQEGGMFEPATCALALILAANLIDLIPNSGITPLTWMLAGALWGRWELESNPLSRRDAAEEEQVAAPGPVFAAGRLTRSLATDGEHAAREGANTVRYARGVKTATALRDSAERHKREFEPRLSRRDDIRHARKSQHSRYDAK